MELYNMTDQGTQQKLYSRYESLDVREDKSFGRLLTILNNDPDLKKLVQKASTWVVAGGGDAEVGTSLFYDPETGLHISDWNTLLSRRHEIPADENNMRKYFPNLSPGILKERILEYITRESK